jgi:hypothetical protein
MEGLVIKCDFCYEVPREVVEAKCCSRIYCWNCIFDNSICKCGCIINSEQVVVVPELQQIIDDSVVDYCINVGCNYSGSGKQVREHKNVCEYRIVPCPADENCGSFAFRDLVSHSASCQYSYVSCEVCGSFNMRHLLKNHYCPEALVTCICGEEIKSRNLAMHKENFCTEAIIFCPYTNYGCPFTDTRTNVKNHLNEDQENHLQLLDSFTFQKEQQIRILNAQVNLPLATEVCNVTRKVGHRVISSIPESTLVKRGVYLVDNCTKETLFKILFFFFIATLLPMKYFIIRLFFTIVVMRRAWLALFAPSIRSARYSRSCCAAMEQMIYLALFAAISMLFFCYSRYL